MISTLEPRPLFTDLGQMAQTITNAIRGQQALGVQAEAVHINPDMLEVMGQMMGARIIKIGEFPVVPDARVPMDRFWLRKPKQGERKDGLTTLQMPQRG